MNFIRDKQIIAGIHRDAGLRRRTQQAFTLVETLMTVMIVGIFFGSLYTGFIFGFQELELERESLLATQLVNQKIELFRLYSWSRLTATNFVPSTFQQTYYTSAGQTNSSLTYSGTIAVTNAGVAETYSNTLTKIIVTVTWQSRGQHQRQMSTLVSQYGMQNAIYY